MDRVPDSPEMVNLSSFRNLTRLALWNACDDCVVDFIVDMVLSVGDRDVSRKIMEVLKESLGEDDGS